MALQPVAAPHDVPLAAKLEWLRRPACYPQNDGPVDSIETHFAWVFFTRDRAYKLKKPVRIERMDFGTIAARHWNCLEELRLNRRLAAGVYLDVVPLVKRDDGSMALGVPGNVVDWLVEMVRLDGRRMLDARLRAGDLKASELRPALELLSRFYRDQPRIELLPNLFRRRLEAQVERNRTELLTPVLGLPNSEVRELIAAQLEFLAAHHELFAERARQHVIIEGHGDLRPEHLYLGTPPCVIDCLEFDRDLRLCDPIEELAFLGIECARRGASWIGGFALDVYGETCEDRPDRALVEFYTAHRAVSRAKVVAWHMRDPAYRSLAPWPQIACEYLRTGRDALERARHQCGGDGHVTARDG